MVADKVAAVLPAAPSLLPLFYFLYSVYTTCAPYLHLACSVLDIRQIGDLFVESWDTTRALEKGQFLLALWLKDA